MSQEILQYIYGALWMVIAVLIITRFAKENKLFYLAGGWFALFGILTIVNELLDRTLLIGALRWILQGITGVAAVILIIVFLTDGRRSRGKHTPEPFEAADDVMYEDEFSQPDLTNEIEQSEPYDAPYDAPYDPPYEAPDNNSYGGGYDPYDNSGTYGE